MYCDSDKDLLSFMLVCKQTYCAVCWAKSGVWRHRYAQHFDLPLDLESEEIKRKYTQLRHIKRHKNTDRRNMRTQPLVVIPSYDNVIMLIQGKKNTVKKNDRV